MFERAPEQGLFDVLSDNGVGCIAFSPLAGGVLPDRYLQGIPEDSRIASKFLNESQLMQKKWRRCVSCRPSPSSVARNWRKWR